MALLWGQEPSVYKQRLSRCFGTGTQSGDEPGANCGQGVHSVVQRCHRHDSKAFGDAPHDIGASFLRELKTNSAPSFFAP